MAATGIKRTAGQRYHPMAEINVTPFVDVMLVLLVVFMVTAPLLTVGVEVDLPESSATGLPGDDEPLTVSIDAEGLVFLQELEVDLSELIPKLQAVAAERPDLRIFVRGDKGVAYGRVMEVMGTINAAGFGEVGLVTALPTPQVGDG
ncbi:MAG: protein TolR [Alphaproteobacteria bacterium]|jgi:biopolymer transport protein TolR|nr:protein TolR [Alphaproteobacteria bacterium]